jgi:hypothetical protein
MTKEIEGSIVSSRTTKIAKSNAEYGYIGIETQSNGFLKLKVDHNTTYDTLDRGEDVIVRYDTLGDTKLLVAKEIKKRDS